MKPYLRWVLPIAGLLAVVAIIFLNTSRTERSAAKYALTPNLGSGQQESNLKPKALPKLLELQAGAT